MTVVPDHEQNRKPLHFRPAPAIHDWVKAEAARRGIRPGELLTHLVLNEQDRLAREGK